MAFTAEQKKQLTLMVDSPKEFLQKCKDGKIYLPSYGNEFFKDGAGIFHILAECIINNTNNDYIDIMHYLLGDKNKLNLFQQTGRKPSAFSLLKDGAEKDTSLFQNITDFLLNIKDKRQVEMYSVQMYISTLSNNGQLHQIQSLLNKFDDLKTNTSLIYSLTKTAIQNNRVNLLELLFSNKETFEILKEKMPSYKFNYEKSYNNPKNINAYGYAVYYGSTQVLEKLVETFGNTINFNGKMKLNSNDYMTTSSSSLEFIPHPLSIALDNKNKSLFQKYYDLLDLNAKAEWISKKEDWTYLYDGSIEKIILNDLVGIFQEDSVDPRFKLIIFNHLLRLNNPNEQERKFQNMEKILEPLWDLLPPIGRAYSFMGSKFFFNNFHSKGDMSEQEIDSFVNIFKNIKKYGHYEAAEGMFSNSFFNEPILAKKLIEAGLGTRTLPTTRFIGEGVQNMDFNIYDFFLNIYNRHKNESTYNKNNFPLNLDKVKETLKIIYEFDPSLVFNYTEKNESILKKAIEYNSKEIYELLSVEDFKRFKQGSNDEIMNQITRMYWSGEQAKDTFNICLNKMYEAEFDFSQEHKTSYNSYPYYYYLFDKVSDFTVLGKILDKIGVDFNKEIQKYDFWMHIKTDNAVPFLKERIKGQIEESNARTILTAMTYSDGSDQIFNNLIEVFPSIYKTKLTENENILHNAIKNQAYKLARKIVDQYPDLAIEANKKNKMPISYMIVNFAKSIKKASGYNSAFHEQEKHKNLFNSLINSGLESPNKKANEFLEDQLKKYTIIEETFPEAIKEYQYHKMKRALPVNNAPKIKKSKI